MSRISCKPRTSGFEVELSYGPDGGVYVLDWSDIGECHENDGVHRTSGRIFKYRTEKPSAWPSLFTSWIRFNWPSCRRTKTSGTPGWPVVCCRSVPWLGKDLGQAREAMLELYRSGKTAAHRLRAMWVLHSIGAVNEAWLLEQSHDENEHVRVWSIKLLTDAGAVSDAALDRFVRLAKSDGLVQRI